MKPVSYWSPAFEKRISRRRALAATGAAGAAAAFLAACGGSDEGSGKTGDKSGLVTKPEDTSKQAKRGGILKGSTQFDPSTMDPHQGGAPLVRLRPYAYSRLLRLVPGHLKEAGFDYTGDLAESYERSPDGLSMTLKLRPGIKFHNKAPVNGRALGVEDVLFTWQRVERISSIRAGFSNNVNPAAPIVSFSAPDSRTIVVKVAKPVSYLEAMLAQSTGNAIHIIPKEADSTFNIRGDMIGTGHFQLEKYDPSGVVAYKRFADYYDKERPYIDGTELPIMGEYAARMAQFRTGNQHLGLDVGSASNFRINAEDIVSLKRDTPELLMYQTDVEAANDTTQFGALPGSPFHDERVRKAYSMALDRDLWIDSRYNVSDFEKQGIPSQTKWRSVLYHLTDDWWIDPRDKNFGPNAQWFKHNVAEAKKLLAAAGYPNGLDVEVYANRTGAGNYDKWKEVNEAMTSEAGFRYKVNLIDYATDFIPNYRDNRGKHKGITYKVGPGPAEDPVSQAIFDFHSKGGGDNFYGFDVNGRGDQSGDPFVDNLLGKAEAEPDAEKRRTMIHELQRYVAGKMYVVRAAGGASGLTLAWPAVRNFNVFRGDPRGDFYIWLDTTKPPFTKA